MHPHTSWLVCGVGFAIAAVVAGTGYAVSRGAPEPQIVVVPGVERISVSRPAASPTADHDTPRQHPTPCAPEQEPIIPFGSWEIADDHFGPLSSCSQIDVALLRRVLPGFDVVWQSKEDAPLFVVDHGATVMEVSGSGEPTIDLYDRRVATPWGIRVGDSLDTLRAHHRDITCEGPTAHVTCRRPPSAGWPDSLSYRLDHGRVSAIAWTLRGR